MGKFVANEGFTMLKTPNGTWVPGSPNYTLMKATKEKLSGQKTLISTIVWTLSPGGCNWTGPGTGVLNSGGGSMNATAMKKKCDGMFVMRQDDQGVCNGMFTVTTPGPVVTPVPCNCTFKISVAGQIKVKAE